MSDHQASNYDLYLTSINKSCTQNIAKSEGIKLPAITFGALQNAQDSIGDPNREWTITVER
ncbi:hypothetical protein [Paenibacillus glacialis]|uniref:hypothetical protein n=1 Tax=Paenibacillus glacialis TaxID=494026 RepID=UPI0013724429|nr:hypothetical protein [Paenibacillus glacialis]